MKLSRRSFNKSGLLAGVSMMTAPNMLFAREKEPWAKMLTKPGELFSNQPFEVIYGQIPVNLNGSLYRNGPGRYGRSGKTVGHLFDGDGAILGIHFKNGKVSGNYRYVETPKFLSEEAKNKYLYPVYGTHPENVFRRGFAFLKNPMNTNILVLNKKVYALAEGGSPFEVDPETLEPLGLEQFSFLKRSNPLAPDGEVYTAHPHWYGDTLHSFGLTLGPGGGTLRLFNQAKDGRLLKEATHQVKCALLHDFAVTERYLIFPECPVTFDAFQVMLGLQTYSDALTWNPNLPTKFQVFDRLSLEHIAEIETDAQFIWHFANAYESSSSKIILEYISHPDFKSNNQWLAELPNGTASTPGNTGKLSRIELDLAKKEISSNLESIMDNYVEMPTNSNSTIFAIGSQNSPASPKDFFDSVFAVDKNTGNVASRFFEGGFCSEAIPANLGENAGVLLTVVNFPKEERPYLYGLDSIDITRDPLFILQIPGWVPWSFHGTWQPKT